MGHEEFETGGLLGEPEGARGIGAGAAVLRDVGECSVRVGGDERAAVYAVGFHRAGLEHREGVQALRAVGDAAGAEIGHAEDGVALADGGGGGGGREDGGEGGGGELHGDWFGGSCEEIDVGCGSGD